MLGRKAVPSKKLWQGKGNVPTLNNRNIIFCFAFKPKFSASKKKTRSFVFPALFFFNEQKKKKNAIKMCINYVFIFRAKSDQLDQLVNGMIDLPTRSANLTTDIGKLTCLWET